MGDELKVPKELQLLLEKRKRRGRRKEDLMPGTNPTTPPIAFKGPERRKRGRRKKGA